MYCCFLKCVRKNGVWKKKSKRARHNSKIFSNTHIRTLYNSNVCMKVTGFSFIKNAIKYQYPVVEAIQSILPLCDEVVVAVGQSEDDTRNLVASIDPVKIKIIDTVWDDSLREGGRVLAVETDKA